MHAKKLTIRQRWAALSRKRKALIAGPLAVLLLGGIAAAVMLFRAPITGTTHVSGADLEFTGTPSVAAKSGNLTCTPTINNGTLNLAITNALPGNSCDIATKVGYSGDDLNLKVQSVTYSDKITTGFVSGCGVTPNPTSAGGSAVTIRFAIPSGTARGDYPAAADAGVNAVQGADYVSANCPSIS